MASVMMVRPAMVVAVMAPMMMVHLDQIRIFRSIQSIAE